MIISRRTLLEAGGLTALATVLPGCSRRAPESAADAAAPAAATPPDYTIRMATGLVELAPDRIIATTLYNGQFPGPLIRLKEGRPVTVDLYNDTDTPEQLHWHGQTVPIDVDGSAEEGTPDIPPHGHRRITFTPGPAGLRFYHTHVIAGRDLRAGMYGGQVGPVYIEPAHEPGAYDREVFLVLKEFEPAFSRGGDMAMGFLAPAGVDTELRTRGESAMQASLAQGKPHGYEVGYRAFSINGRMLGHGEPIRVERGERVLLHVVNGSATEIRSLALPGHTFQVVALDGNPLAAPVEVPVLWLGTAERVSAIVDMHRPGVWILGDVGDDRENGLGIVVEYAGATGKPRWSDPPRSTWDYARFGRPGWTPPDVDETIEMTFTKDNAALDGFNQWRINDTPFSMEQQQPMFSLRQGARYRLRLRNATDDIHPVHLHRQSFEIVSVAGRPAGGVIKDVAMVNGYQVMEIDFTAEASGLSLFHCHQQVHMDFGFMALFDCT
jgi:FtsP/CotA-like multicopper oxidase with cupredoxin domain